MSTEKICIGRAASKAEGMIFASTLQSMGVPVSSELGGGLGGIGEGGPSQMFIDEDQLTPANVEAIVGVMGQSADINILNRFAPTEAPQEMEIVAWFESDEAAAEARTKLLEHEIETLVEQRPWEMSPDPERTWALLLDVSLLNKESARKIWSEFPEHGDGEVLSPYQRS